MALHEGVVGRRARVSLEARGLKACGSQTCSGLPSTRPEALHYTTHFNCELHSIPFNSIPFHTAPYHAPNLTLHLIPFTIHCMTLSYIALHYATYEAYSRYRAYIPKARSLTHPRTHYFILTW